VLNLIKLKVKAVISS